MALQESQGVAAMPSKPHDPRLLAVRLLVQISTRRKQARVRGVLGLFRSKAHRFRLEQLERELGLEATRHTASRSALAESITLTDKLQQDLATVHTVQTNLAEQLRQNQAAEAAISAAHESMVQLQQTICSQENNVLRLEGSVGEYQARLLLAYEMFEQQSKQLAAGCGQPGGLSLIHISEPTRPY
eukprot:TRINITY_DN44625_c0_g1_i1.p1 TRINITY_DN44625_c0_g1~~TRINITY_DN44625_c0_g1_i1.p1  ORF type:complete len:186 (-),score=47.04 TRINITY_DN44625_c0_g1_i1:89-646(-)